MLPGSALSPPLDPLILNPIPPRSEPYTLHPAPYTLDPGPGTLNPER